MLSLETVRQVEAMLAEGSTHFTIARDLRIPLTSVAWIEAGRHPRLRGLNDREQVRQRRILARRAKQRKPVKAAIPPKALRKPKPRKPSRNPKPRYLPTPEQIAAECAKLRESAPRALA